MIEPWHIYGVSFIICMIAAKCLIYFDGENDTGLLTVATITPVINTIIAGLIVTVILIAGVHYIITWVPEKDEG